VTALGSFLSVSFAQYLPGVLEGVHVAWKSALPFNPAISFSF
jgi:hypothetical protein